MLLLVANCADDIIILVVVVTPTNKIIKLANVQYYILYVIGKKYEQRSK